MQIKLCVIIAFFVLAIQIFSSEVPHISIVSWKPSSNGRFIFGRISFDSDITFDENITEDLTNNYALQLKSCSGFLDVYRWGKNTFTIVVDSTTTRDQFAIEIDKVSQNFQQDFEKAKEELKAKEAEELRVQKEAEEARKAKEIAEATLKRQMEEERCRKTEEEKKERNQAKLKNLGAQGMLNAAILNDSEEEIRYAIESGAQINFKKSSQTPLLRAILLQKERAIKVLLGAGANPDLIYLDKPIVHWCIKNGKLELAMLLIGADADFSGIVEYEQDAFSYVSTWYKDFVLANGEHIGLHLLCTMIKHGYDIKANFSNKKLSNNAWYLAIRDSMRYNVFFFIGWSKTVPFLNQIFSLPGNSAYAPLTYTPLLLSIKSFKECQTSSAEEILHMIIMHDDVDVNKKSKPDGIRWQSPLSYIFELKQAADSYQVEYPISLLIKKGADLTEAIKLFITNGGSPDHIISGASSGTWPLLGLAILYNSIEAVKFLISAGASVNQYIDESVCTSPCLRGSHTLLFFALQQNNDEIVEILIDNGATI